MSNSTPDPTVSRMTLLTLVLTRFVSGAPGMLFGLLLIEISATFGTPVGITGQIRTVSSTIAVISALIVGIASVKYNAISILVAGYGLLLLSAIGSSISSSYEMMMLFFPLTGIGISMIGPMGSTLVAQYYPRERRPRAIGWMIAGGASAYLVGAQAMAFISGIGTWRLAYYGYVIPIIILGLLSAQLFLVKEKKNPVDTGRSTGYLEGLKSVMTNKSAFSSLIGSMLRMASFQSVLLYSASLFRHQFSLSREATALLVTLSALCYVVGSVFAGRIVNRMGKKRTTIIAIILAGVFVIAFTTTSSYPIAIVTYLICAFCFGTSTSSGQSLNLEQVPDYRGSMMSMSAVAGNLGAAVGSGIGGFVLLIYSYTMLGPVLGSLGLCSSLFLYFVQESI